MLPLSLSSRVLSLSFHNFNHCAAKSEAALKASIGMRSQGLGLRQILILLWTGPILPQLHGVAQHYLRHRRGDNPEEKGPESEDKAPCPEPAAEASSAGADVSLEPAAEAGAGAEVSLAAAPEDMQEEGDEEEPKKVDAEVGEDVDWNRLDFEWKRDQLWLLPPICCIGPWEICCFSRRKMVQHFMCSFGIFGGKLMAVDRLWLLVAGSFSIERCMLDQKKEILNPETSKPTFYMRNTMNLQE